jgi:protein SCO1
VSASFRWVAGLTVVFLTLAAVSWLMFDASHQSKRVSGLSKIGPAPEFTLTAQDGKGVSLTGLRGKVVVVAFIYTNCPDACPLLTAKMATLETSLGADFGRNVAFVSITVDPERDTPEVLARYARTHSANVAGWDFLTGSPGEIANVALGYGVVARKIERGTVDHALVTTIVDQRGIMRVQYLGTRFDPEEFLRDIRGLLDEARS